MPLYEFINVENEDVELIFFTSDKVPSIGSVINHNGMTLKRLPSLTNNQSDAKIDPFSEKDFVEKTGKKKGTMGDLWDTSERLRKEREAKMGYDPVTDKFYKDYEKKYKQKHFGQRRKEANQKLSKLGVTIE